jgi:hypothetical protein
VDRTGLPAINTRVDVLLGDVTYPSRIEDVTGDVLQVVAPLGPGGALTAGAGDAVELAWIHDGGRVAVPARLATATGDHPVHWEVRIIGDVRRQTRRGFMRGGGGERIRFQRAGGAVMPVYGWVMDIGEVSVRARLEMCDYRRSDPVTMTIALADEAVRMHGQVLDVRQVPENGHFDIIVTYEVEETDRRAIRGYILRRQLEERRRLM